MQQITWLALGYQVPINPSKNRVYVWRKLKEFGAGYFKQGVAILPKNPGSMARFKSLAAKIREMGGEATLAELRFCERKDEMETISRFQSQSEDEYRQFIRELAHLRDNVRKGGSDMGDSSDQAKRMVRRYGQVHARDYFKSASLPAIARDLDELIGDMAHATNDLSKHFALLLAEMEK